VLAVRRVVPKVFPCGMLGDDPGQGPPLDEKPSPNSAQALTMVVTSAAETGSP